MSRISPEPVIRITTCRNENEETGEVSIGLTIDADIEGFSNGYLMLDELTDIFILRDAINKFISRNKLTLLMEYNKQDLALDAIDKGERIHLQHDSDEHPMQFLGIVEGYLSGQYEPVRTFIPGRHRVVTSQEILLDLSEMADLELNDVAAAMTYLGYRVTRHEGKTGWVLAPVRHDS